MKHRKPRAIRNKRTKRRTKRMNKSRTKCRNKSRVKSRTKCRNKSRVKSRTKCRNKSRVKSRTKSRNRRNNLKGGMGWFNRRNRSKRENRLRPIIDSMFEFLTSYIYVTKLIFNTQLIYGLSEQDFEFAFNAIEHIIKSREDTGMRMKKKWDSLLSREGGVNQSVENCFKYLWVQCTMLAFVLIGLINDRINSHQDNGSSVFVDVQKDTEFITQCFRLFNQLVDLVLYIIDTNNEILIDEIVEALNLSGAQEAMDLAGQEGQKRHIYGIPELVEILQVFKGIFNKTDYTLPASVQQIIMDDIKGNIDALITEIEQEQKEQRILEDEAAKREKERREKEEEEQRILEDEAAKREKERREKEEAGLKREEEKQKKSLIIRDIMSLKENHNSLVNELKQLAPTITTRDTTKNYTTRKGVTFTWAQLSTYNLRQLEELEIDITARIKKYEEKIKEQQRKKEEEEQEKMREKTEKLRLIRSLKENHNYLVNELKQLDPNTTVRDTTEDYITRKEVTFTWAQLSMYNLEQLKELEIDITARIKEYEEQIKEANARVAHKNELSGLNRAVNELPEEKTLQKSQGESDKGQGGNDEGEALLMERWREREKKLQGATETATNAMKSRRAARQDYGGTSTLKKLKAGASRALGIAAAPVVSLANIGTDRYEDCLSVAGNSLEKKMECKIALES